MLSAVHVARILSARRRNRTGAQHVASGRGALASEAPPSRPLALRTTAKGLPTEDDDAAERAIHPAYVSRPKPSFRRTTCARSKAATRAHSASINCCMSVQRCSAIIRDWDSSASSSTAGAFCALRSTHCCSMARPRLSSSCFCCRSRSARQCALLYCLSTIAASSLNLIGRGRTTGFAFLMEATFSGGALVQTIRLSCCRPHCRRNTSSI